MDVRAIFGRYWPASSAIHDLDARTKMTAMVVLAILLLSSHSFWALGPIAAFVVVAFALARIPLGVALRTALPLAFIVVITAFLNMLYVSGGPVVFDWGWMRVTEDGILSATFMASRLILLLLLGALLTLTTTTIAITNAIETMLRPLEKVGLPISEFAFVMGTALRFLPQLAEDFRNIRIAQEARGARLSTSKSLRISAISSFIVPLFASVLRHADTLAAAMESRCYRPDASIGRSTRRLGKGDAACLLVVLGVAALVACISVLA